MCTKIEHINKGFRLVVSGQLEAHKTKSTCMERFLTLIDMNNFALHYYPSLTVQKIVINGKMKMGRSGTPVGYCLVHEV